MVRAMADGEIGEHGFALTVPDYDGTGFSTDELAALGTFSSATLRIDYGARSRVAVAEEPRGPQAKVARTPTSAQAPEASDLPR